MKRTGAQLWTAEIAYGDRPFEVTETHDPYDVQLRSNTELFHKENALNLIVQRLPNDWEYVAWIDADVEPATENGSTKWLQDTVERLQTYKVVQMFQQAIDIGPDGETMAVQQGFAWSYLSGRIMQRNYSHWHPGFAWAMRRDAWDSLGGLIDYAILGSADNHMAYSLIGKLHNGGYHPNLGSRYVDQLDTWEEQAERYVRRNIGYTNGTILHHWHGKKKNRQYADRNKILIDLKFDPARDLKRDWQGLWQLADHGDIRSIELRDAIRGYFRNRREDSIDTD